MKTKQNIFSLLLLFITTIIIGTSCKSSTTESERTSVEVNSTDDSLKRIKDSLAKKFFSLLEGIAEDSINNHNSEIKRQLIKTSLKFMDYDEPSGEVPGPHIPILTHPFNNVYNDNINTNIEFVDLNIKLSKVLTETDLINIKGNPDRLIAFYNVLVPDGSKFYSSFVITQAYKENIDGYDTIKPIPNAANMYLMFTKNNPDGTLINATTFNTYTLNLFKHLEFKQLKNTASPIYKAKDYHYPMISHHLASEFYLFYFNNKPNFQIEADVLIRIERGLSQIKIFSNAPGTTLDFACQNPISVFSENNNDILFTDPKEADGKPKYYLKALDVGRLCPPQCN